MKLLPEKICDSVQMKTFYGLTKFDSGFGVIHTVRKNNHTKNPNLTYLVKFGSANS